MIITLVFQALFAIANMFLSLFPAIELDFNIGGYVGTVAQYVGYLDTFVSLSVLAYCISAILIVDNFGFIIKVFNFVWSKLPFIS